jgi:hypothetical protein
LNAVAQAEGEHEYLTEWIAMTDDPEVTAVLGTVAPVVGTAGSPNAERARSA